MKRHLLAILLAILLLSCEDVWHSVCGGDYVINLLNNTSDTICVFTTKGNDTVPDVSDLQNAFPIANTEKDQIFAFDESPQKLNVVQIYVMDKDTLERYGLKKIIRDYQIMLRYSLSGHDILNLNYTIPYPPSAAMKDMKMYPPYEEVIKQEKGL